MICLSLKSLSAPTSICAATNILISFVEESSGEGTYVGEETGKRRWVMREKKPIEFSLKSPRCTLNTPHLTSPDWKKNGVQGNKNHKNIFCIRKKGIRFFTKRSNKKSNLVFQQKINAYALKKAKTRGHHRNPSPIAVLTSLSREKKNKNKNTTIEPVTNKTTKPRHSRQQRNDPASRSRKKKRTRKAKTPADSSDHDSQRNRPGSRC